MAAGRRQGRTRLEHDAAHRRRRRRTSATIALGSSIVGYGAANCFGGRPDAPLPNTTPAAAPGREARRTPTTTPPTSQRRAGPACRRRPTPRRRSLQYPTAGATGVARDANVSITFSEPVDASRHAGTRSSAPRAVRTRRRRRGGADDVHARPDDRLRRQRDLHGDGPRREGDRPGRTRTRPTRWRRTTSFTFQTVDQAVCGDPATKIGAIQGAGASAAITGNVTVEGVVVGDFEGPTTVGPAGLLPAGRRRRGPGDVGRHLRLHRRTRTTAVDRRRGRPRDGLRPRAVRPDDDQRLEQRHGAGDDASSTARATGSVAPTDVSMPFAALDCAGALRGHARPLPAVARDRPSTSTTTSSASSCSALPLARRVAAVHADGDRRAGRAGERAHGRERAAADHARRRRSAPRTRPSCVIRTAARSR